MQVETLIAAVGKPDCAFLDDMRIQTDAVVIDQCGEESTAVLDRNGHSVVFCCTRKTGVGPSRNQALARAMGDILLFADEDLVYVDGYAELLQAAFAARPQADVIVFNIRSKRPRRSIRRPSRVRWFNYMRYGAARIAARRASVERAGLRFSGEFGGGGRYGSGEDTIFLHDCLRRGLRIYAVPLMLASTDDADSSWFHGYDARFFADKGALMAAIYGRLGSLFCWALVLRHPEYRESGFSFLERLRRMRAGLRGYLEGDR